MWTSRPTLVTRINYDYEFEVGGARKISVVGTCSFFCQYLKFQLLSFRVINDDIKLTKLSAFPCSFKSKIADAEKICQCGVKNGSD